MSTRATIACGDGWHLYEELIDDSIGLDLDGGVLGTISIPLPQEVLEAIMADRSGRVRACIERGKSHAS